MPPEGSFNVGIGLKNIDQGIYAQEITLGYDPDVFEFVSGQSANDSVKIVNSDKINITTGAARIIAVDIGGLSTGSSAIFNVTFNVKAGVQNVTGIIAVTQAKLGTAPQGTIIEPALISKSITIGGASKTQLTADINSAESLYADSAVGTQPGQYPQAAKDTFRTAIDAAIAVRDNTGAAQAEVDSQLTALSSAKEAFLASVIPTPEVSKTQLTADINSAENLYANSEVGTQPGQYPQAAKDTFRAAIDAAKAVRDNTGAVQAQVDSQVTALGNAKETFLASVIHAPSVNKTALTEAISTADTLYAGAVVGTLPGQYPQAAKDAFNTAIIAAKSVNNNSNASQSQVDSAVTELNAAVDSFKAAVNKEVSADLNNNGSVDVGDLAIVAYYYNADPGSENWEAAKVADINKDNKVDIEDLAFIASRIAD